MRQWVLRLCLILALLLLGGCQQAAPPAVSPTTAPAAGSQPHATLNLEVIGPSGSKVLTMADLRKLPAVEGWAGIKNSAGKITPPVPHKGVLIAELCRLVGGLTTDQAVNIVAKDGYAMTMSYDQAIKGNLITYDPGTGDEVKISEPLQVIIAYEREGKPMSEETDGTFRLMAISSKNNQVVDGHWTVKWVRQVVIKSAAEEWTLHLEGTLTEEMDRATFESGAAPNCHGETWTDDKGQKWTGIPLWYLVGRVDDDLKHQTRAFNDKLAEQGYKVEVVAADGYTVSLDSMRIKQNNNILVCHLMDDKPLENKYFPLRLAGSDLQKNEMVGQIVKIKLH